MATEKKKRRFNLFDAIVIIVILVLAAGVYYISHRDSAETTQTTYMVELTELPAGASAYVNVGDQMTDTVKNGYAGTVVSVEEVPYTAESTDYTTNTVRRDEVEGYCNLQITLQVDTTETDSTISTAGGMTIRVGTQCSLSNSSLQGSGYILSIER